ncbi:hypothetical protein D3OALGA1CA_2149 [Olavius algarvensis associated proteobacterium Delta 3]|nr:hypothetical protein D3OALGA1CA_2149 [Olavius algarvensis associated proteobacterium Delta 3]CAB5161422.1 hypothetical protein D3OALGB2SA_5447 [Olavius algarvensis associated proteobacterium Delta 3]
MSEFRSDLGIVDASERHGIVGIGIDFEVDHSVSIPIPIAIPSIAEEAMAGKQTREPLVASGAAMGG